MVSSPPASDATRLSVVIPTRRRPEMLRATLDSLLRCDPLPREVIIVDGDEDRSAEPVVSAAVTGGGDRAKIVRYLASPPGLTRQRNRGVKEASGDVIVFADDDVEFSPKAFGTLASAYDDPAVAGATGKIIEDAARRFGNKRSRVRRLVSGGGPEGSMTSFGYPRRIQDVDRARDVEFMQGCWMSGRRELVEQLGFDEHLAGYGLAEDEDFSYRLSRRGRLRYLPAAEVRHYNTGFRSADARAFNRMVVVNRAYLFRKNFSPRLRSRVQFGVLIAVLVAHRVLNREWEGVRGLLEGSAQAWRSGR